MLRLALPRLRRTVGRSWPGAASSVRHLFVQTENTPNPESLKFIPGKQVLEHGTMEFGTFREAQASPLARRLFQVDGVKSIFLTQEFITVTKDKNTPWSVVKPHIFEGIMDFFAEGLPVVDPSQLKESDTTITDDDSEVVAMIKELIETRVRPSVQEDGGDISFVSFSEDTGVVLLKLQGSCAGCPSSSITLKSGIENMMMHYIPEVTSVEAIDDDEEEDVPHAPTPRPSPRLTTEKQQAAAKDAWDSLGEQ